MLTRRLLLTAPALLAKTTRKIQVIAHRGEHLDCPENTLPAIQKAIDLGCDWVELDVRTTADGHFILMHNATVDSTTNGQGPVAGLTLRQIQTLDAGIRQPSHQGTRVPTLDEALDTLRSRCGIYLDAKQIPATSIVDRLKRHRMLDHALVYGSLKLLKDLTVLGYPHLAMPEAVSLDSLKQTLQTLKPRVIAFDRRDFQAETIALARSSGHEIFVDRLGDDDTPEQWQNAIRLGATGIQTDHPAALVALVRQRSIGQA
jgi:glycerophosphoryl diester phosphodiesterase